jgi:hypothetical protein
VPAPYSMVAALAECGGSSLPTSAPWGRSGPLGPAREPAALTMPHFVLWGPRDLLSL